MRRFCMWILFFAICYCVLSLTEIHLEECPYIDKKLDSNQKCDKPENMVDEMDETDTRLRSVCKCPHGSKCHETGGLANSKEYTCKSCIPETELTSGLYLGYTEDEKAKGKHTKCEDL